MYDTLLLLMPPCFSFVGLIWHYDESLSLCNILNHKKSVSIFLWFFMFLLFLLIGVGFTAFHCILTVVHVYSNMSS